MSTVRSISTRRLAALLALMPLVWLVGACERRSDEPTGPGSGPGDSFTLPEEDVSALTEALQERVRTLCEAVQRSPRNPDQVGALGTIYFVHGFPQAAATCFARACELGPQSMHWWYYSALAYERTEAREKAVNAYERALELDATYGSLYARLARLLVESDRERAASLCQRALELNPKDATAMLGLGLCVAAEGDLEAALKQIQEALRIMPDYREAHEALARVLISLEREEEARQHREMASRGRTPLLNDHLFETLLRTGLHLETLLHDALTLAGRGLFEEADRALDLARGVDPYGVFTHRITGSVRAMQGRLEEAAEEYRSVLEARPDAWNVKAELAEVQAQLGQHTEAEAGFLAVLAQDPTQHYALEHYVQLLLKLERSAEAEKLLREAAARQPEDRWIRLQLGSLLFQLDRDAEAREQFQECLEQGPVRVQVRARHFLGLLARRAGDMAGAKKHWEQVLEKDPGFLDAYVALAEAAIQEGDSAAAERYLRQGMQRAPNHSGLNNGLAWILATSSNDAQRNGEEALRLAKKACELTQNSQHEYVDTLAAAYAELGRFDDAVAQVQEAIRLAEEAGQAEVVAAYRQRLALYEQKQPYREAE